MPATKDTLQIDVFDHRQTSTLATPLGPEIGGQLQHTTQQKQRDVIRGKKKKSADFGATHKFDFGDSDKRGTLNPKEQFLLGKAYTYLRFATILPRI